MVLPDARPVVRLEVGPADRLEVGLAARLKVRPAARLKVGLAARLKVGPAARLEVGPAAHLTVGPVDRLEVGPADRLEVGPADRLEVGPAPLLGRPLLREPWRLQPRRRLICAADVLVWEPAAWAARHSQLCHACDDCVRCCHGPQFVFVGRIWAGSRVFPWHRLVGTSQVWHPLDVWLVGLPLGRISAFPSAARIVVGRFPADHGANDRVRKTCEHSFGPPFRNQTCISPRPC